MINICILKENKNNEFRVPLVPGDILYLKNKYKNFNFFIQPSADRIISDEEYYKVGCKKYNKQKIDLFISNYSFSECNSETQDFYINNIIKYAKNGYITHNASKERSQSMFTKLKSFHDNLKIYDLDLSIKQHPIFTWKED